MLARMRSPVCLAVLVCACANAAPAAEPPASTPPVVATSPASDSAAPSNAAPAAAAPEVEAQHVAERWLADVDGAKFAESWMGAASAFRSAIDQPGWVKAVTSVRGPLGVVKSRALRSAHFTTSVPGAPEGQYVVITYDTAFEKRPQSVETVTPTKDTDGQWRVSGYFVK